MHTPFVSLVTESNLNNRNFSREIIDSISSSKKQKVSRFKAAALTLAVFGAISLSAPVNALTITADTTESNGLTLTDANLENASYVWYGLSVVNSTLSGKNEFKASVSKTEADEQYSTLNIVDLTDAQLQWQGNAALTTNSALSTLNAISLNNSAVSIEGALTADLTVTRINNGSEATAVSVGEGKSVLTVSENLILKTSMPGDAAAYEADMDKSEEGDHSKAIGISSRSGGSLTLKATETRIESTAEKLQATGIVVSDNSSLTGSGNLTINAVSGRDSQTLILRDGGRVVWNGDVTLSSTLNSLDNGFADNEAGNVGIFYSDHDLFGSEVTLNGNVSLSVEASRDKVPEQSDMVIYNVHIDTGKYSESDAEKITIGGEGKTVTMKSVISGALIDKDVAWNIYIAEGQLNVYGKSIVLEAVAEGNGGAESIAISGGEVNLGSPNGTVTIKATADDPMLASAISVMNGTLNLFGDVSIESGTVQVFSKDLGISDNVTGAINVKGNINLPDLSIIEVGKLNIEGSVTTNSAQVFENAASASQTKIGALLYEDKLDFQENSKLILTDAEYTVQYLDDIKNTLANKPIIQMNGTLVEGKVTLDTLPALSGTIVSSAQLEVTGNSVITNSQFSGSATLVGVGSVQVTDGDSITIAAGDNTFTIVGANGGDLVSGNKGPVSVIVGTGDVSGKLIIGGSSTQGGVIQGSLTVNAGSSVSVEGNAGAAANFQISSDFIVKADASVSLKDGAILSVDKAVVDYKGIIRVGQNSATGVGKFISRFVSLAGSIFLDPAWENGTPALGAIETVEMSESGNITVGQNSALVLGSQDADLALNAMNKAGLSLSENGIKSALYLAKPLNVGNGSIVVDGTLTSPAEGQSGVVSVAADSLLAVEMTDELAVGTETAITGASLNLADGSTVLLAGMEKLTISEDLSVKLADSVVVGENVSIYGSSGLWYGYGFKDGVITAQYDPTQQLVDNGLTAPNVAREAFLTNAESAAALRELINVGDYAGAARWMNQRALFASAGAAQAMAVTTSSMVTDTVEQHGSLISSYSHDKAGVDLWINIDGLFTRANSYEAGSSKYGYRADLAGVTFGADYAMGNGLAAGLAVSLGKGNARSRGEASGIKNKIEYWGLNLYGAWNTQYANVIGSIGYIQSENDMRSAGLKAKPDTKALTAAVRVEKDLNIGDAFTVTPHIGARYSHIKLDNFSAAGFSYSAEKANLFQIPVGVAVKGNYEAACGAKVKPFLDLTVSPTMGDKKVSNRFALEGSSASDSIETRIANTALFNTKLGLEATRGNHSLGVSYGFGAGNKGRIDQALQAKYRYVF